MNCKLIILFIACGIALCAATPVQQEEELDLSAHVRHARSPLPDNGNIELSARKDQAGREAGVQYNHRLFTSNDGRGSIDAYANAQRNFDHNRNNFGGGVQGKWRF